MTEYELMGTIEVNFTCETLGKLKESEIKTLFKKTLEKYLEDKDNVSCMEEPVGEVELSLDYEKIE